MMLCAASARKLMFLFLAGNTFLSLYFDDRMCRGARGRGYELERRANDILLFQKIREGILI